MKAGSDEVTEPLVSVYMPTFNRSELLGRAVRSVLNQTHKNFELIVVNDGSTDATSECLAELSSKDSRLIVLTLPESSGACNARNLAISSARGKFVTGLDDDDEFHPQRLETFLQHYDDRYSFLCDYRILALSEGPLKESGKRRVIDFNAIKRSNVVGNQAFISRDRLDSCHRFDPDMPGWQDYDLWFRLIRDFGPALKLASHTYCLDERSAKNRISNSSGARQGYYRFLEKHTGDLSKVNRAELRVSDLYNRRVKLSILETIFHVKSYYCLKKCAALYLMTHAPSLYQRLVSWMLR